MQARERILIVLRADAQADFFPQAVRVEGEQRGPLHLGEVRPGGREGGGGEQQIGDVAALQAAVRVEKLEPVAVVGQVARGDHDGAVVLRLGEDDRHEHRRGGREPAVVGGGALRGESLERLRLQRGRGDARVVPHADLEGGGRGVFLLREPQGERLRDQVDGLARQVDVLTLDPFGGDSAHVAAVLQLEHGFLGDGHGCSSRHDKFFSAGGGLWTRGARRRPVHRRRPGEYLFIIPTNLPFVIDCFTVPMIK